MDAGRGRRVDKLPQPRSGRLAATPAEKGGGAKTDAKPEDLPPGWVRVESRSKPGAFFYAHPATKRTQLEKPGSERKVGPERPRRRHRDQLKAEGAGSSRRSIHKAEPVEVPDAPAEELVVDLEAEAEAAAQKQKVLAEAKAEAAARKQKVRAEAEAEEAARVEALRKARERRALFAQAQREEPRAELAEDSGQCAEPSASASASASTAAKATASKPRRAGVRASAGSESQAKKRRKAWQKDTFEEGDEDITQEDLERWKEENDWRETSTEEASNADSSEAHEDAIGPRREVVPEPEQIFEPCLDVLKSGLWVERHPFIGKEQWILGRAAGQVDVPMQHESISRHHATVIRKGQELFVADMGSAHGTLLDSGRLLTNTLVKLEHGAQLRFGASTRLYVFHAPQ